MSLRTWRYALRGAIAVWLITGVGWLITVFHPVDLEIGSTTWKADAGVVGFWYEKNTQLFVPATPPLAPWQSPVTPTPTPAAVWNTGTPSTLITPSKFSGIWRLPYVHYLHGETDFGATVPVWQMMLPAGVAIAWWWRRKPIPPGHCVSCGYNLLGSVSELCTECGTPVKATRTSRPRKQGLGLILIAGMAATYLLIAVWLVSPKYGMSIAIDRINAGSHQGYLYLQVIKLGPYRPHFSVVEEEAELFSWPAVQRLESHASWVDVRVAIWVVVLVVMVPTLFARILQWRLHVAYHRIAAQNAAQRQEVMG